MSRENVIDLGLNDAYNDLFSTQEERDNAQRSYVIDLAPEQIGDFPNHPFHVRMDESMMELAESVKQYGVLVPSLVRPLPDGGYQMVSGHRRKRAAELAALPVLPCIVRDLTDDEAVIIMVDSNLQRERVLPSEKAFAYKMKLDAMKRQGQRTDLTSVPVAQKSGSKTSRQLLGEQVGESQDQVRRYIRLTKLIPELLNMVDHSVLKEPGKLQMALRPAVELFLRRHRLRGSHCVKRTQKTSPEPLASGEVFCFLKDRFRCGAHEEVNRLKAAVPKASSALSRGDGKVPPLAAVPPER